MKIVVACSLALCVVVAPAPAQTAREIVDQVDRMLRGNSSRASVRMEIVTEHWSRAMEMDMWSLGADHALIRITSPAKEAGTATLKAGKEMWNYLPRVDRTIKLPPSLMGAAWMGSHFTNDDLVKESRIIEDYEIDIAFEGDRDGVDVWEFRLVPKTDAAVVWGKIEEQVRKSDMMPVWVRYFDDDGELTRTMTFSEYKVMDGRLVPAVSLIQPADKPQESTSIIYDDLAFDIDIDESFFSLRQLRSDRR